MKRESRIDKNLKAITLQTVIMGVDIAKTEQWARFVDYRGVEIGKAIKFRNDRNGFEIIVAEIIRRCKEKSAEKIIVGMEPTGHYWKALANYLMKKGITVVLVNPFRTKKAKELDDNSPTKSDVKDALTIAKLVKDGRYYETYLPHDVYAELRVLTANRISLNKRKSAIENTLTAVLDEYFPEYETVFKNPYKGKASMRILKICPLPVGILTLGEEGVLTEVKKAVKKTVGRKKVAELVEAAKTSVGVDYGESAARFRIQKLVEELELVKAALDVFYKGYNPNSSWGYHIKATVNGTTYRNLSKYEYKRYYDSLTIDREYYSTSTAYKYCNRTDIPVTLPADEDAMTTWGKKEANMNIILNKMVSGATVANMKSYFDWRLRGNFSKQRQLCVLSLYAYLLQRT